MIILPHIDPASTIRPAVRYGRLMIALSAVLLLTAASPSPPDLTERLDCEAGLFEESRARASDFFDVPIDAEFALCQRSDSSYDFVILDSQTDMEIARIRGVAPGSNNPVLAFAPLAGNVPPVCSPDLELMGRNVSPELERMGVYSTMEVAVIQRDHGLSEHWFIRNGIGWNGFITRNTNAMYTKDRDVAGLSSSAGDSSPYSELARRLDCEIDLFEESRIQASDFFDVPMDVSFVLCKRNAFYLDFVIFDDQENVEIERLRALGGGFNRNSIAILPLDDPSHGGHIRSISLSPNLTRSGTVNSTKKLTVLAGDRMSEHWYIESGKWRRYLLP